jgi:hypothetical protein
MTIAEMVARGKQLVAPVVFPAIIVITATGSFGLGILAQKEAGAHEKGDQLWIENLPVEERGVSSVISGESSTSTIVKKTFKKNRPKANQHNSSSESPIPSKKTIATTTESTATISAGGGVVGSKSGHTYYLPWCGMVNHIKESNKVFFKNREAADAAHYTPAKNCKGL